MSIEYQRTFNSLWRHIFLTIALQGRRGALGGAVFRPGPAARGPRLEGRLELALHAGVLSLQPAIYHHPKFPLSQQKAAKSFVTV